MWCYFHKWFQCETQTFPGQEDRGSLWAPFNSTTHFIAVNLHLLLALWLFSTEHRLELRVCLCLGTLVPWWQSRAWQLSLPAGPLRPARARPRALPGSVHSNHLQGCSFLHSAPHTPHSYWTASSPRRSEMTFYILTVPSGSVELFVTLVEINRV